MIYQIGAVFISVLIVYSMFEPPPAVAGEAGLRWLNVLVVLFWYGLAARWVFGRVVRAAKSSESLAGLVQRRYRRYVTLFTALAVLCFCFLVVVVNIKADLLALPWAERFPTLSDVLAIGLFLLFLVTAWWTAYPAARAVSEVRWTRSEFVLARLRLYASFFVPWIVLSLLTDLLELVPSDVLGGADGIARALLTYGTFIVALALFGPMLIRSLWGLTPLAEGHSRRVIEAACARADFRYRDIMLWPLLERESMTAGVMGLVGRFRYIMISPSLLDVLKDDELVSVIGHEIGHVKKAHLVYYILFLIGFLAVSYPLSDLFLMVLSYTDGLGFLTGSRPETLITKLSLVLMVPVLAGFIGYFRFVFGFFMRNFERQADLFSLGFTGGCEPLVRSLQKIAFHGGASMDAPSWHHFSIRQRVHMLWNAARNPDLIRAHDSKIRKSLAVYLVAITAVAGGSFALERSSLRSAFEFAAAKKALVRYVENHPRDAAALSLLGAYLSEEGEYAKAESMLTRALDLNPDDAETLNNLAWMYATSKDSAFKKIPEAVDLAERAVRLDPAPHILDTLAESYFQAGRLEDAVRVAREALAGATLNRAYYERQLKRFRDALEISRGVQV